MLGVLSPDGELVPVESRLAEIHDHYGPGHLVSRSVALGTPDWLNDHPTVVEPLGPVSFAPSAFPYSKSPLAW